MKNIYSLKFERIHERDILTFIPTFLPENLHNTHPHTKLRCGGGGGGELKQ